MVENCIHDSIISKAIWFDKSPALLGFDGNGHAPMRVYGLRVEGEIYDYEGEINESYWLKALTSPEDDNSWDHIAFASRPQEIETVLGAIVTATTSDAFFKTLDGRFDAYYNRAHLEFDQSKGSEDPVDNVKCSVKKTANGFELRYFQRSEVIASLQAKMSNEGIDTALSFAKEMREWSDKNRRLILNVDKALASTEVTPTVDEEPEYTGPKM